MYFPDVSLGCFVARLYCKRLPPALSALVVMSVVFLVFQAGGRVESAVVHVCLCFSVCTDVVLSGLLHVFRQFPIHAWISSLSVSSGIPLSAGPGKTGSLCLTFFWGWCFWLIWPHCVPAEELFLCLLASAGCCPMSCHFVCLVICGCVLHIVTGTL